MSVRNIHKVRKLQAYMQNLSPLTAEFKSDLSQVKWFISTCAETQISN